jgi:uncharacterized membrane protein
MEIDQDTQLQPVMSQQEAQQGYQTSGAKQGQYDAFFKKKIKSYRPQIIITAILQIGLIVAWPFIAIMSIAILFGEDVLNMPIILAPKEVLTYLGFLDIFTTIISILLFIGLIYFTVQDAKKNSGQNPTGVAILVIFLGFLGAFIYILTTLKKQGKVAKKQVQQAPQTNPNQPKP